jgi:predicted transcriptional regulator
MEQTDFNEFCKIMYLLAENFSSTVTKDGLKFRFAALKDYPLEKVKVAAMQITRTRKYTKMPTVADFVEAIEGDQASIDEDRAELQAAKVIEQIKRVGSWGSPKFDDPVTADIVKRRFGWQMLCEMPIDQTSFFVRDFKAAYLANSREDKRLELGMDIDPEVKKLCEKIGG